MIVVPIFSMKIEVGFLLLVWMSEQSLHVQSDRNQSLLQCGAYGAFLE